MSVENDDNDDNNIVKISEFRHTTKHLWRGGKGKGGEGRVHFPSFKLHLVLFQFGQRSGP